jgi:hypothetical protein
MPLPTLFDIKKVRHPIKFEFSIRYQMATSGSAKLDYRPVNIDTHLNLFPFLTIPIHSLNHQDSPIDDS